MKFKIVLVFCLLHTALFAQLRREIYFEHTTSEQGLSQNSIQSIIQDKTGYLWFGTGDGLNQFDGYKFNVYKRDPIHPKFLSSGNIKCLIKDHFNTIWIGTDAGLNSFQYANNSITHYLHNDKNLNTPASDKITALAEWKGNIWIGTADEGISKYNLQTKAYSHLHNTGSSSDLLSSNHITCFSTDDPAHGDLYIGTEDNGLMVVANQSGKITHYRSFGKVNCIFPYRGSLYIGTDQGLYIGNIQSGFKQYRHDDKKNSSLSNDRVTGITMGSRGEIWVGTNAGLNEYNAGSQNFTIYHHDVAHTYTLSDDRITCLFTDKSGKVWIGTFSGGVDAIDPPNVVFRSFRHEASNSNSLSYDDISAIKEDYSKNIWIGTLGGGLNMFNPSNGSFKVFRKGPGSNTLCSDIITCLYVDHNNIIWIGTQDAGLCRYDMSSQKFQTFTKGSGLHALPSNTILSLSEDLNNNLWIGTDDGGLNILNIESNEIVPFQDKNNIAATLKKYQVRNLYHDDQTEIMWIGSLGGGLFEFNLKTKTLKNYYHKEEKNSLSDNKIYSIFEDINGRLWIGTYEGGLNLFDPSSGKFTFFTEREGIPNNVIYSIVEDNSENLWLFTNKGICKFSPPTSTGSSKFIKGEVKVTKSNNNSTANKPNEADIKVRTYDTRDGLPTNQFNIGACLKANDGKMYVGSISGLVTFEPDSVRDNPYIPAVIITDFKLFNHSVLPNDSFKVLSVPIYETKELNLKYNQNFLSFEFTALNFINSKKNRYAFKLEGFDNDWNSVDDAQRRFATYTNLEPGEYTFRVKGSNNDGIWNEAGASIHIIISPPFWRTWWFRVFSLIILGAGIYFVIWFRLNQIRKTEEQKTEVNKLISEARLIALRAQMNPHFIFNSLNSIQQFIYNNNKEEAATYLSKFSKLIRQILEHSSQGTILLQDESSILNLYLELEALRFQNKFTFEIEIDEDIDPGYTEIPSMLIQPYIENAILHGLVNKEGEGHISVKVSPDPSLANTLVVSIQDNGIGREKAMEINKKKVFKYKNKSMGMSVTNDRLTILNQYQQQNIAVQIIDLKDSNGLATGTRVDIRIPVDEM